MTRFFFCPFMSSYDLLALTPLFTSSFWANAAACVLYYAPSPPPMYYSKIQEIKACVHAPTILQYPVYTSNPAQLDAALLSFIQAQRNGTEIREGPS